MTPSTLTWEEEGRGARWGIGGVGRGDSGDEREEEGGVVGIRRRGKGPSEVDGDGKKAQ